VPEPTSSLERLAAALADRYRLERELGQGGMATVYLAEDLKHARQVAIKVLRPELAAVIGADRFLREIKTIATLQHPHILGLIDSGEVEGTAYYVMPFVEGESLRDRLNREKQLPVSDAVRLATEVAAALDYAHRHNVIHRDIKPENILLHDGSALVADFGIALAVSSAGGTRMTETGMSLGTPHYMSPEQAMGEREITGRSDVYALGAMTYEMLIGDPPFTGSTAQAIVAKAMTTEPVALIPQRKSVPPAVEDAVLTALAKLPADRFGSAADFAAALAGGTTARAAIRATRSATAAAGPWRLISGVLGGVTVGLGALALWSFTRAGTSSGPAVYDAALPDAAPMSFAASTATVSYGVSLRNLSVSPNGDFAVYAARQGDSTALWYRSLRDATAHLIAGTMGGSGPRVSPDGSQVAFLLGDRVMIIPIAGGTARQLLAAKSTSILGWISPTQLMAADADGNRFNWLDPGGGTPRSKAIPRCALGDWIPDLRQLICSFNYVALLIDPESGERWSIRTAGSGGKSGEPLAGSAFRILQGRYVVYLSVDGNLTAARYDPATHLAGRPVTLLTGVRREAIGEGQYDLASNGTLLYGPGVDGSIGRMVSLHRGGEPEPLPMESAVFQRYDLSRDRRWLAAVVQGALGNELRVYDLRDGQHFTWLSGEMVRHPLWSQDGDKLLFAVRDSTTYSILRGAPSSGLRPDTVASMKYDATSPDPLDWHDDHLAVVQDWGNSIATRFDPGVPHPTFDTVLTGARFISLSPNAKLILYQTLEGSRIVVTTFPSAGRRWQLASEGVEPLWLSPTEVLYRLGVSWYLARVNAETGEPVGAPTFWARDPRFSDTSGWSNRPSHDGGIIYVQGPAETSATYLRVVPGWVRQMKAAVDAAN
jgi:tRNA A-37 threonylcarbamoyl transferase component Bud32